MTQTTVVRPGGEISRRPLYFIWLCDCSNSMATDGKMQSLNTAIKNALPLLKESARSNPSAQLFIRVVIFSNGARWLVLKPTPVEEFSWTDLSASGLTDMGAAFKLVAEALQTSSMPERSLPPVLVLVTDGKATDDFEAGLHALMSQPWGKKAVRQAIAIGRDVEYGKLEQFIGNPELEVLSADNPGQLADHIKWLSTTLVTVASQPRLNQRPGPNPQIVIRLPKIDQPSDDSIVKW
jgi:uncharacterized protein YegL